MLPLRSAVKTSLGATLTVSHAGPSGTVSLNVSVVDAGRDDETPLPAVFVHSYVSESDPTNIGGGGVETFAFLDLHIVAVDAWDQDGSLVLDDIHKEMERVLRLSEKSVGDSHFTFVSSSRDLPPRKLGGGLHEYVRIVTVRGQSLESY